MSDTKQILSPYFKSIVDQDRLSIVICDLEHTIIYMNPAAIEDYHKYGGVTTRIRIRRFIRSSTGLQRIHRTISFILHTMKRN